ncbi:hypothetical protein RDJ12_07670 [Mergibacter septicus]|nr:hypothetical protein [Mergibacter septicus]WMR95793.1 hypothetical protein RDJ12_07670 [Mergibacter septicus]
MSLDFFEIDKIRLEVNKKLQNKEKFAHQQGSVYFGNKDMTSVKCVLAA